MAFHNWPDARAYANARAYLTGRRQRVWRGHACLTWRVSEAGP